MDPVNGALGDRLAALRSDFAALGTRAGEAAAGLTATLPPPSALLDELTAAGQAFVGFRSVVVEYAGTLSITLDAENLGTLRDLEPVLAAITAAEEHRTRLAAWDTARKDALGVLGRVMGLTHREDKTLPTLTECQGRARELHVTLAGPAPEGLEGETRALPDKMRPYAELLALIEGWSAQPFLGSGHGAPAPGIIRSDTTPWAYELSYVSLLYHTGVIGTLLYSAGVAWIGYMSYRIARRGWSEAPAMVATLVGTSSFLVANATNPYLEKYDYLWVIFLPLAFVNCYLTSQRPVAHVV